MVNVFVAALAIGTAHPLHSSLTTVAWRPETRTIEVAVRVFTQDLEDAIARRTLSACAYVQAVVTLRHAGGRPVPTSSCALERDGDVTWIRLAARAPDPRGLCLSHTMLFELFADQINIVQSSLAGRARTVVFTRGDGLKALT